MERGNKNMLSSLLLLVVLCTVLLYLGASSTAYATTAGVTVTGPEGTIQQTGTVMTNLSMIWPNETKAQLNNSDLTLQQGAAVLQAMNAIIAGAPFEYDPEAELDQEEEPTAKVEEDSPGDSGGSDGGGDGGGDSDFNPPPPPTPPTDDGTESEDGGGNEDGGNEDSQQQQENTNITMRTDATCTGPDIDDPCKPFDI
jgi:hypothetical protein